MCCRNDLEGLRVICQDVLEGKANFEMEILTDVGGSWVLPLSYLMDEQIFIIRSYGEQAQR